MIKKIIALVVVVLVSACANNLEVTSSNPAEVGFQFKTETNDAVLTFWRRIEANGEKSDRFSVGVNAVVLATNSPFPSYQPEKIKLDAGTYYLDSYQVPVSETEYCVSEKTHYLLRNGWNDVAKKPHYLSFKVKNGQKLTLPEVVFDKDCKVKFKDPNRVFTVGGKLTRK